MSGPGLGRLVAWLGREYFARGLEEHGWRLALHSYHRPRVFTWREVVDLCGGAPDVLVLGDRSHPPPFLGLERYPCLTVFYSVDSHIHSWHPLYAQAFDAALVSLKDHLPGFARGRLDLGDLLWSPPYALSPDMMPWTPVDPRHELLFAGTVDPVTTPGRADFLARLGREMPELAVRQGHFLELFPRGRVILNVAERGDLNFRVFEALAMGKPLLTPEIGHGQRELFTDGLELTTYRPGDVADCAAKARALLADPIRARAMGRAGLAAVDAAHRSGHRAKAFSDFLSARLEGGVGSRLAQAEAIRREVLRPLHLHWAEAETDPALKAAYLGDARG